MPLGKWFNLSVPQFHHLYATWFSSFNLLWAKMEPPVSLMLVPPSPTVPVVPVEDFWGSHPNKPMPAGHHHCPVVTDALGQNPPMTPEKFNWSSWMMWEGGCLVLSIVHCCGGWGGGKHQRNTTCGPIFKRISGKIILSMSAPTPQNLERFLGLGPREGSKAQPGLMWEPPCFFEDIFIKEISVPGWDDSSPRISLPKAF